MRLFENLGTALFSNCANLPTVTITAQKSLPATMFGGCCSLSNVVLSGLTSIGAGLFDGCTNLKTIFVPEGVAMIGRDALANSGSTNIVYKGSDEPEQKLTVIEFVKKVLEILAVQVGLIVGVASTRWPRRRFRPVPPRSRSCG